MNQSRWKSKVMWAAIVLQLTMIADVTGLWQVIGVDRSVVLTVVEAVLAVLVIVGVINNPENKNAL